MKRNYYYTDKSQTPLSGNTWTIFSLIFGAIYSLGMILQISYNYDQMSGTDIFSVLKSSLIFLFITECVLNLIWIVMCIITCLGLSKLESYGWSSLMIMLVFRIIANIILGILWIVLTKELSSYFSSVYVSDFSFAFASLLISIPIFIYYDKRKPIFFPDMIENIPEEQKRKYIEIKYLESEELKDFYKSEGLNVTIPLSNIDDEE